MVRFDQPCQSISGAREYFRQHMATKDYLAENSAAELTWYGQGAEKLGLAGQVKLRAFEAVGKGLHPVTGERLGMRQNAHRRVCFFGQISAPKDVSIAYLVGGDQRIGQWWREAVGETLREIEASTATRVRKQGAYADRETGNMVAAIVQHETSRSLDPQLHTHVCIFNVAHDPFEGRWKGVQPTPYYQHQGYFREVCYNKLASRMNAAGYVCEPTRGIGFTLKGMPAQLRETFSKRRRGILTEAKRSGLSSQNELQALTVETRARKQQVELSELQQRWKIEAGDRLTGFHHLISQSPPESSIHDHNVHPETIDLATDHLFERRSVADGRILLKESLIVGRGKVDLGALKAELSSGWIAVSWCGAETR